MVHFGLHSTAVVCIGASISFVVASRHLKLPTPKDNLYSAHAILGVIVCLAAALQYSAAAACFWWQLGDDRLRARLAPIHAMTGIGTYVGGLLVTLVRYSPPHCGRLPPRHGTLCHGLARYHSISKWAICGTCTELCPACTSLRTWGRALAWPLRGPAWPAAYTATEADRVTGTHRAGRAG